VQSKDEICKWSEKIEDRKNNEGEKHKIHDEMQMVGIELFGRTM